MSRTLPTQACAVTSDLVNSTECETRRRWEKAILFDVARASRRQKVRHRGGQAHSGPQSGGRDFGEAGGTWNGKEEKIAEGEEG